MSAGSGGRTVSFPYWRWLAMGGLAASTLLFACDGPGGDSDGGSDAGAVPERDAGSGGWDLERCRGASCAALAERGRPVGVLLEPTLTVLLEGDGAGVVRSDPPGMDCALPCSASFPRGTALTLTIEPAYRSTLEGITPSASGCEGGRCTIVLDARRTVTVHLDHHPPVRLSDADRDPRLRLRDDGLAADFYVHGGARSVQSIAPRAGVFYFEGRTLIDDLRDLGFGVATASAPLRDTYPGETDQSFGVGADGALSYDDTFITRVAGSGRFGLVVDYRRRSPLVHVIAPDAGHSRLVHTQPLPTITAPLHLFVAGSKRAPDFQIELNPGNDTTNLPFALDPRAALRAEGLHDVADALVLGWGDTYAGPVDAPPVVRISPGRTVASGTPLTVSASAMDAEEGDLSAAIEWELLSSPHYAGRIRGTGPTFSFTPTTLGVHPVRASVRDRTGRVSEAIAQIRVDGTTVQHSVVRLTPDAHSGGGIELSPDGLSARWTIEDKHGIRANQALYGGWGYFEIHRLTEVTNQGGGLVTGDGNLAPYSWDDVPASCSVNMLGGVWRDLMWMASLPLPSSSYDTYGFAVDYREEHPIVYVIAGGAVASTLVLEDVWVEVYPMLYGNRSGATEPGEYDQAINFGGAPFRYDAAAALTDHGVDTTGFVPGWGDAHTSR